VKKLKVATGLFLSIVLACVLFASACSPGSAAKMNVVTSTSLMAYIAQQVGGDRISVTNLVPPSQHPGNFDYKPGDVKALADAKLFLLHGWPGEAYADKIIAAANNPNLKVVKASVDGNWMVPPTQAAAADKVADALGQTDTGNANTYKEAANAYRARIQTKEAAIRAKFKDVNTAQTGVICSVQQADFLKWLGFNVVGTYADAASLTPQALKDLVDKGKAAKVVFVADNLQSAKDAGKGLAEELSAKQINLSNFPGGYENTETWEKAVDKNVDLIIGAISK
jgi:ABC-type Zn uptake system ZnuABC Zn-binding protein ZnuA